MFKFLIENWQWILMATVALGGVASGGSDSSDREYEDDWAGHPMNKDGMNWMHD